METFGERYNRIVNTGRTMTDEQVDTELEQSYRDEEEDHGATDNQLIEWTINELDEIWFERMGIE